MADLYTRKIEPVPEVPVKNGKAIFGSFSGRFKKLDIAVYRVRSGIFLFQGLLQICL